MKAGVDYIGVGCGAIIINDNDEILLVKRSLSSRTDPGLWSRPGGEVEFGETVHEAVEREVLEETGIRVKIDRFLCMDENMEESKHWIALGFLTRYVSGEVKNLEPDKHDEVKWVSLNDLPKNLTEYTRHSLDVYLSQH